MKFGKNSSFMWRHLEKFVRQKMTQFLGFIFVIFFMNFAFITGWNGRQSFDNFFESSMKLWSMLTDDFTYQIKVEVAFQELLRSETAIKSHV